MERDAKEATATPLSALRKHINVYSYVGITAASNDDGKAKVYTNN